MHRRGHRRSVRWGIGGSIGGCIGESVGGSIGGSVGRSIGGSVSGSIGRSVGGRIGGSVHQNPYANGHRLFKVMDKSATSPLAVVAVNAGGDSLKVRGEEEMRKDRKRRGEKWRGAAVERREKIESDENEAVHRKYTAQKAGMRWGYSVMISEVVYRQ